METHQPGGGGGVPPGKMLLPLGSLPSAPALDTMDSEPEGLGSKQMGLESPLKLFNKGSLSRSQQAILSYQKV